MVDKGKKKKGIKTTQFVVRATQIYDTGYFVGSTANQQEVTKTWSYVGAAVRRQEQARSPPSLAASPLCTAAL